MIGLPNDETNQKLFLFSSDSRHLYKSDVYDTLAYPSGHIMQFRYRSQWVNPIWNLNQNQLIGQEVIVCAVIVNRNGGEPTFFPVRKGKITKTEKEADNIFIFFELLPEWIDYRERGDYNEKILEIRNRPKWSDGKLGGDFVGYSNATFLHFSKDIAAWQKLIEKIAATESYKDGVFFNVVRLNNLSDNTEEKLEKINDFSAGYKLKGSKNYCLDLLVYYGKEPPPFSEEISLKICIPDFVNAYPIEVPLGFIIDKKKFFINPMGTLNKKMGMIKLEIIDKREGTHNLETPHVEIPISDEISSNSLLIFIIIGLGLFTLSGALVAVLMAMFPSIQQLLESFKPWISIVGTLITTIGIWWMNQVRG